MRGTGTDLLDGFQVGSMIGKNMTENARRADEAAYKKSRDAIEDTFKREQLAQQGEDRGLRRQEMGLRMDDLSDAIDQRKKERARQELAENFTAQGIDSAITDKVNSLKLKPLTAPMAGAPGNTPSDPIASQFNTYFAYRNQVEDELNSARASGDPQAIRQATEKWQAWSSMGPQIAQAGIQRQSKKPGAFKVKTDNDGKPVIEGEFDNLDQALEFRKKIYNESAAGEKLGSDGLSIPSAASQALEGRTSINKQSGQRMIFKNGQWTPLQ